MADILFTVLQIAIIFWMVVAVERTRICANEIRKERVAEFSLLWTRINRLEAGQMPSATASSLDEAKEWGEP